MPGTTLTISQCSDKSVIRPAPQLPCVRSGAAAPNHPQRMTSPGTAAGTVRSAHNARKDAMNNPKSYSSGEFRLDSTPMIVGACLIGAGTIIGMTGLIVGGSAIISATRQWFRELEVPPSEVVKQKLSQTKAATAAGASAWQRHNGMQTSRT
jgi:hypothetical protein